MILSFVIKYKIPSFPLFINDPEMAAAFNFSFLVKSGIKNCEVDLPASPVLPPSLRDAVLE
jgi:hypothetical protein